jgi:hypothetical protein
MIVRELLAVFGVKFDEKPVQQAATSFDGLIAKAKIFGGVLAAGAVANGIKNFIAENIEFSEQLARTSKRMGIQAEALQELRYAAEQAGVGHDALDGAMQRFIVRAAEAQKGTGDAKSVFKELGVELKDASGGLKEPSELLARTADGFGRITNQADKARIAQALFDEEGIRLVDVLAKGSQSLSEMRGEARLLGVVMSKESVEAAENLSRVMKRVHSVVRGIGYGIIQSLMPPLQRLANGLETIAKGAVAFIQQTTILKTVLGILGVAAVALGIKMAIAFGPVILIVAAVAAAIAAVVLVVDDLYNLFTGGESLIGQFFEWLKNGFKTAADYIRDGLANLVPDFLKEGLKVTAKFFASGEPNTQAMMAPRTIQSQVSPASNIYSPNNQSVKVDVNVKSGANPKEIGSQVARMVGQKLDEERRNAYAALVQRVPS